MQMWNHFASTVKIWLEVKLYSKKGDLVYSHKQPVRSFLANWTKALYGITYSTTNLNIVKVVTRYGGSVGYPSYSGTGYPLFKLTADEGDTRNGIIFGSGTTPPSIDDYDLEAPIPHGTEAGELYYNASGLVYDIKSDRGVIHAYRTASNQSGEDVTVSEIGLAFIWRRSDGNYYPVLVLRDVLDEALVVPHTYTIEGRYIFEFVL